MNLFQFWPADQRHSSWLIHMESAGTPCYVPKPKYERFVCSKCRKFSHDQVFKEGFGDDFLPKVSGHIFTTDDGFLCVNQRFVDVIQAHGFPGLELKRAGNSDWRVVNVSFSFRVDVTPDVYVTVRSPCEQCGRRREVIGSVQHIGQLLTTPQHDGFFSTASDRECTGLADRNLFASGAIVEVLKREQIKGGVFHKLYAPEEYSKLQAAWQMGQKLKLPKDDKIVL